MRKSRNNRGVNPLFSVGYLCGYRYGKKAEVLYLQRFCIPGGQPKIFPIGIRHGVLIPWGNQNFQALCSQQLVGWVELGVRNSPTVETAT